MKRERTLELDLKRIERERQPKIREGTPIQDDGDHLDLSFDGTYLRIKWQGSWYRTTNTWIQE